MIYDMDPEMPPATPSSRVAVIGGGIVGATIALALLDRGHRVTVYDADAMGQAASWGNAGHIAVEQVAPLASPASLRGVPARLWGRHGALSLPPAAVGTWLPFALRLIGASRPRPFAHGRAALSALMLDAMPAWHRLARRLEAPDLVIEDGHFIVWESAASARHGAQAWGAVHAPTAAFRPADAGELERLAALMGRAPAGAIRCLGSGRIASHARLREGLRAAIATAGGDWRDASVRLERDGDGRCRVVGAAAHDLVVLAAGIGARPLAEAMGHTVPMVPERGYHLHGAGADWPADLPPVVFEDRSMIVTRFENGVRASSFVELAPVDRPADPAKWAALRGHLRDLRLPFDAVHSTWMGARPTLPDYLPAIGRSNRATNLIYAFGHQHLGLTLAPVTAALVADLAEGCAPAIDLAPFSLARFEQGFWA